jgi:hypothetical protein
MDRERSSAVPHLDPQLHIHGVVNQDPSTTKHPVIGLLHRGELTQADIDVVLPAAVDSDFAFWLKELSYSLVMVHSKTIVVDPFGPNPAVMTGSHNMGEGVRKNDDNLMIIDDRRSWPDLPSTSWASTTSTAGGLPRRRKGSCRTPPRPGMPRPPGQTPKTTRGRTKFHGRCRPAESLLGPVSTVAVRARRTTSRRNRSGSGGPG